MTIDDLDRKILAVLRADGRASVLDIAKRVGLSATPVSRRIRQLEDQGIIDGYTVVLNEAAVGLEVSVFVSVQLDKQVDEALAHFERAIETFPEVVDCWLMTGNRDYLLRVVTRNLKEFEAFLVGRLTKVTGVSSIESSIPLRRVKANFFRSP